MMKQFTVAIVALMFVLASPASASPKRADVRGSWGLKILDVGLVRPVGIATSLASTALDIGLLPITLPEGIAPGLADYMVEAPWRFTTYRYVGHFNAYRDGADILGE